MLSRVETFARGDYQAQGKEAPASGLIETASKMSYSLVQGTTRLTADRRSRSEAFVLCVLLLLGGIIWLPRLTGPIDLRWDAGAYYVLGTSLAEGRGYRLLNEPGNIESIQYPPLLPSVIAIYQLALGTSDPHRVGQALRFTFAFVFIAFVLTSYLILKHYLPTAYALLGALIVLVNPTTIVISDFCLSDLPFALISALFFLFQQNQNRRLVRVLTPLTAVAAYSMRTAGVALLAAWVAEGLLKCTKTQAAFRLLVSLLAVLGWQYYVHYVESGQQFRCPAYEYQRADSMYYNTSYARNASLVDPFVPSKGHLTPVTMTKRFVHNLVRMPRTLGEAVSPRLDYWKVTLPVSRQDQTWRCVDYLSGADRPRFFYSGWNRSSADEATVADSALRSVLPGACFCDAIRRHVHSLLDTADPFPFPIAVRGGDLAEAEH